MITKTPHYDLSTRNTFRMKVQCALYVEITAEEDLPALDWDALPQPVFVMGGGSNLLFTQDFPGTVLHVKSPNPVGSGDLASCLGQVSSVFGPGPISDAGPSPQKVTSTGLYGQNIGLGVADKMGPGPANEVKLTIPAGVVFDEFCAWAAAQGLWGPENLSLIPGEVGASAVQNIGAYGVEAKDIIAGIRAWDRAEGRFVDINPADCAYGYRTSKFKTEWKGRYVITAVTYRLSRIPQPRLDYGGVRKALEDSGVDLSLSGNSVSLRSTPAPPIGCADGPLPRPMCGGAHVPERDRSTPLSPKLVRETIIGIRRQKLPDVEEMGSAGSFFCNPVISREHFERIVATARDDNGPDYEVPHYEVGDQIKVPAAWMIDQCGFKGARNGGAQVYPKQPLVIVNASGEATPQEVIGLEHRIIQTIESKYGITLHPEVEHV